MTQIRRRFTGAQQLQVESRPDFRGVWKPVSHLVALGYDSPFTSPWELRHAIAYGGRPGASVLPFQPLSVRHFSGAGNDVTYRFDNALSLIPSGGPLTLPAGAQALDYEARIGLVLARELSNATAEEAIAAIGAWVLLCLFDPVDRDGTELSPVPASLAGIAVPANDLRDSWRELSAAASVNGQVVGQARATDSPVDLGELLADASVDEPLERGELVSIDALSSAHGGEPLAPGDHLIIAVPRLGRIEHTLS